MNAQYQSCLEAVMACASACEECCAACIDENHPECIKWTGDCAQICWNFASFLSRGSEIIPYFAKLCEEVCEACAKECEQYQDNDHHQRCVAACRSAMRECKKIAANLPGFDRANITGPHAHGVDVTTRHSIF